MSKSLEDNFIEETVDDGNIQSKIIFKWRSQPYLPKGKEKVAYKDDVLFGCLFVFLVQFYFVLLLLIAGNQQFLGLMVDNIFLEAFRQMYQWILLPISISMPFNLVNNAVADLSTYMIILNEKNMMGVYMFALFVNFVVMYFIFENIYLKIKSNAREIENEVVKRGALILKGIEAVQYYNNKFREDILKSKTAMKLGRYRNKKTGQIESLRIPFGRMIKHAVIFGASGSGKSQLIINYLLRLLAMAGYPIKIVILDIKSEFTPAYYDEENPAHVLLDITDARSHTLDYKRDLVNDDMRKKFAASIIPSGEGEAAMWNGVPQNVLVGLLSYASDNYDEFTAKDIYDLYKKATYKELEYIFQNYCVEALAFIPPKREDGSYDTNNATTNSFKAVADAYITDFVQQAKYINNNGKVFSVRDFMLNPKSTERVVFIRTNSEAENTSKAYVRSVLGSMAAYIDNIDMPDTTEFKFAFILEELAGAGKLVDQVGLPILNPMFERGRSKGVSMTIIMQDQLQMESVYKDDKFIEQLKANSTTQFYAGLAPGATAKALSEQIGKQFIDKTHTSIVTDAQTHKKRYGDSNVQQHEREAITPQELVGFLGARAKGIRFLMTGSGFDNVLIVDHPYTKITPKEGNRFHPAPSLTVKQMQENDGYLIQHLRSEIKKITADRIKKYFKKEISISELSEDEMKEARKILEGKSIQTMEQATSLLEDEIKNSEVFEEKLKKEFRDDLEHPNKAVILSKRLDLFIEEYRRFKENSDDDFIRRVINNLIDMRMPDHKMYLIKHCLVKNKKMEGAKINAILKHCSDDDVEMAYLINSLSE